MKFSQAVTLGFAPLAMAGKARRSNMLQPPAPRNPMLAAREHAVVEGMSGHGFTAHSKTEIVIIWANPGGEHPTETYNEKVTVTETITVPAGGHETVVPGADGNPHTVTEGETAEVPHAAATHTVVVGGPGGLIFQPEQLEHVPVGDMVIFEFLSKNHTVTQSPFDTPCDPLEGGMDTGFQPNPDDSIVPAPQVAMQVTTDKPLWFYCKQGNHCGAGMVFSINPTPEKTHAMFKELAIAQNGEGEGTPITGEPPIEAPPADAPPADAPPADAPPADAPPADAPPADAPPADSPPADAPPAETPPAGGDNAVVPGNGVVGEDGSCICMVSCSAGSFPNADVQGLNAWGGIAGSIPLRLESIN